MPLKTGDVAARTGVSRDTVRYYERLGLLPRASRTRGGYREYADGAVARVRLVQNALRAGFSLKQLARFLRARDGGDPPCRSVRAAGVELLASLDRQIAELTAAREALQTTLAQWDARLDATSSGSPAHLLDHLHVPAHASARSTLSRRHS